MSAMNLQTIVVRAGLDSPKNSDVDLVHRGEIGSIGKKHAPFTTSARDAPTPSRSSFILFSTSRVSCLISPGESYPSRIDRDLAREENEISRAHGGRVRPARCGNARRFQSFNHDQCPSASSIRSASMAAMQPAPAAVIAWR